MRDLSYGKQHRCPSVIPAEAGFSFLELLVAMAATTIVMGAVFGLLARGLRTTPVEMERADLQAQARHALDRISQDVLLAGADLPPEYPAFTPPGVNRDLDEMRAGSDVIEIVGNLERNVAGEEPIPVLSFDGQTAVLASDSTQIQVGDLVLLYDDAPTNGSWVFGLVAAVQHGPNPALMLKTMPGDSVGENTLPWFIQSYNRSVPTSGFVTPVMVVSYLTDIDSSVDDAPAERVLWRQVNWGEPQQVAFLENLQIRYFVGGAVDELVAPQPPSMRIDNVMADSDRATPGLMEQEPPGDHSGDKGGSGDKGKDNKEKKGRPWHVKKVSSPTEGLAAPPVPQPVASEPLPASRLVQGVRISITSRSHQANLEGSEILAGQPADADGYLRVTLSTRVSPRNLLFGLSNRQALGLVK